MTQDTSIAWCAISCGETRDAKQGKKDKSSTKSFFKRVTDANFDWSLSDDIQYTYEVVQPSLQPTSQPGEDTIPDRDLNENISAKRVQKNKYRNMVNNVSRSLSPSLSPGLLHSLCARGCYRDGICIFFPIVALLNRKSKYTTQDEIFFRLSKHMWCRLIWSFNGTRERKKEMKITSSRLFAI